MKIVEFCLYVSEVWRNVVLQYSNNQWLTCGSLLLLMYIFSVSIDDQCKQDPSRLISDSWSCALYYICSNTSGGLSPLLPVQLQVRLSVISVYILPSKILLLNRLFRHRSTMLINQSGCSKSYEYQSFDFLLQCMVLRLFTSLNVYPLAMLALYEPISLT